MKEPKSRPFCSIRLQRTPSDLDSPTYKLFWPQKQESSSIQSRRRETTCPYHPQIPRRPFMCVYNNLSSEQQYFDPPGSIRLWRNPPRKPERRLAVGWGRRRDNPIRRNLKSRVTTPFFVFPAVLCKAHRVVYSGPELWTRRTSWQRFWSFLRKTLRNAPRYFRHGGGVGRHPQITPPAECHVIVLFVISFGGIRSNGGRCFFI